MSRRKKFKPEDFEKNGTSNLSSTIYASMLQSEAFINLSNNAKVLFMYMKLQLYGQKDKPQNKDDHFVFNKAMYTKNYQLFSNGEQFTKYKNELIKYGFIEEVENGKTTRSKNIYRFLSKWKVWKVGDDFRTEAMKKHDAELKEKRQSQKRLAEERKIKKIG